MKIKDIAVVTGSINPIYRKAIWDKHKIYFATPEVVRNDLMNDILSLKDFSLIVFDEAHRAVLYPIKAGTF
ncbi:MAG: hypothetical protein KatS3mg003_0830 [Candidatus Nitrosocaldaceae archaeon]|nr:MAG: hypothetical protein KatS3mg003_0830 [Candidatus Nitrosocaldaceae archaeon]